MRKLELNVEDLALETFDATTEADVAVEAFANTNQVKCTYFCNYPTGFC